MQIPQLLGVGKPPSPKHPVTPIQTSGVQRRVGGGPLVGGRCPLVWEVVLLVGKPPQEQAMTPIQTAGVHKTEGGGPLVGGSVLRAGKPPSPKQPMTHIRTSGVQRTVGGAPLVWGVVPWWVVPWLGVVPLSGGRPRGRKAPLRTGNDLHPDTGCAQDSWVVVPWWMVVPGGWSLVGGHLVRGGPLVWGGVLRAGKRPPPQNTQ